MQKILFNYMKFNFSYRTQTNLHKCITKCDLALDKFKFSLASSNASALQFSRLFTNTTENGRFDYIRQLTKTSSDSQIPDDDESSSLKNRADNLFLMGDTLFKKGKLAVSIQKYAEAKELYMHMSPPDYFNMGRSLNNMGQAQFQLKEFDKALMSFEEALKLKHKQAWVIENKVLIQKTRHLN